MTEDPRRLLGDAIHGLKTHLEYEVADGISEVEMDPALLDALPASPPDSRATRTESPATQPGAMEEMGPFKAVETLEEIRSDLGECTRCNLCEGRKNIVFGVGSPNADLVIVGEAPGRDEDIQAEPFVGRSGQLLNRMLEAIGLSREDIYICNVIKCRPPENRNPTPDEVETCEPFLIRQLKSLRPKVILAMGKFAAQTLLQTEERISRIRGNFHEYHGIPVMPTFHPAYLLRNQSQKRVVWEDLQKVHQTLGLPPLPSSAREGP
ncbi:MAG: uracil-DNA glycosylase [Nitrospinota bacterium]|nr:uracil-DNA glycosylase [Nitrospinota bacterium]MDP6620384.1 uracil-DNA glycosylase [Nitrospinota bacterium]